MPLPRSTRHATRTKVPSEAATSGSGLSLSRRLEQLNRIVVGVLDHDLTTARAGFHLIAKVDSGPLQDLNAGREILYGQNDPIPSAGLLTATVRHRSRTGRARTAQQNAKRPERDTGKGWRLLMVQRKAEVAGIEGHRPQHI